MIRRDNRNPKHKYYVQLLNSREWRELRTRYMKAHPYCERCRREGIERGVVPDGYISSSFAVHHIKPVEGVPGDELTEAVKLAMRERCFDPNNVIALCAPCHKKTHDEMKSHDGQSIKSIPKEADEHAKRLAGFASKVTGVAVSEQVVARPKKGIRKTRFGWLTKEEYKKRMDQEHQGWRKNIINRFTNGLQGTDGETAVDAQPED